MDKEKSAWFAIKAFNSRTFFVYGTKEEAKKYAEFISSKSYFYIAHPLTDDEAECLKLNDRDDTVLFWDMTEAERYEIMGE